MRNVFILVVAAFAGFSFVACGGGGGGGTTSASTSTTSTTSSTSATTTTGADTQFYGTWTGNSTGYKFEFSGNGGNGTGGVIKLTTPTCTIRWSPAIANLDGSGTGYQTGYLSLIGTTATATGTTAGCDYLNSRSRLVYEKSGNAVGTTLMVFDAQTGGSATTGNIPVHTMAGDTTKYPPIFSGTKTDSVILAPVQ